MELLNSEPLDYDTLVSKLEDAQTLLLNGTRDERKQFWNKNKSAFKGNINSLVDMLGKIDGWDMYVAVGEFVNLPDLRPYNPGAWSIITVSGASEKQGYELLWFCNTVQDYKSLPALVPFMVHEFEHAKQSSVDPIKYLLAFADDGDMSEFEKEAEAKTKNIYNKFVRQSVVEGIVYCLDEWGWDASEEMANYYFQVRPDMYSGGYNSLLTKEEFGLFKDAKDAGDMNIFIRNFLTGHYSDKA